MEAQSEPETRLDRRNASLEGIASRLDALASRMEAQQRSVDLQQKTMNERLLELSDLVDRMEESRQTVQHRVCDDGSQADSRTRLTYGSSGLRQQRSTLSDRFCADDSPPCPSDSDTSLVDVLGRARTDKELGLELLHPIIGGIDECDVALQPEDNGAKSLDKWQRIVNLPSLLVEDEASLVRWEETAALSLQGKAVPSSMFSMLVSHQQEPVSQAMILRRNGRGYGSLGQFVQDLTEERNFDETLVEQLLLSLGKPNREESVLVAVHSFEKCMKRLRRLCRRHLYCPGLTATRVRNAFLGTLSVEHERHLLKQAELSSWSYRETRLAILS